MVALRAELVAGTYAPETIDAFLVSKPKRCTIFDAGFRDRVEITGPLSLRLQAERLGNSSGRALHHSDRLH